MKTLLMATVAAFALTGTGIATAQTSVGADVNTGYTHAGTKTYVHKRKHRVTTGIETRDNNASARGTLLPGKDRLNSKGYIQDK